MKREFILASQSLRRQELLGVILPAFRCIPSFAEESFPPDLPPWEVVRYLAAMKAEEVAVSHPDSVVIGADTVVSIDGEILGKPKDKLDCQRMLGLLSGRTHQVYTGLALVLGGKKETFYAATDVDFLPLSEEEICGYSNTDEPYDKAGGYGIQGKGSLLIRGICGDFYNVMGLPLSLLHQKLREFDE